MKQIKLLLILFSMFINFKCFSQKHRENTISLKKQDYEIKTIDDTILIMDVLNENLISDLNQIELPSFYFEINGEKKIAKGLDIFSSSLPDKCDYFFPLLGKTIFTQQRNKINLKKCSKK